MAAQEILAKSVLNKSGIYGIDYALNPYLGCMHGCKYCYASFMRRFHKGGGRWGEFVDVKVNAPILLEKGLQTKIPGSVLISSVTDPYQPVEKKFELTRKCLEVFAETGKEFEVSILTKSHLVLRDLDVLKKLARVDVGLTIATDDDKIREIFEPHAPKIEERINALEKLHSQKIGTYAFIGPMLPMNPNELARMLEGKIDFAYLDRMNYSWTISRVYEEKGFERYLEKKYFEETKKRLIEELGKRGVKCICLF
ncbi:radical SAM protein [Candidatus Micrarchaeota archaeon]|nr:radical SAM protein [Candidatus Micrarchaeota archaeon]